MSGELDVSTSWSNAGIGTQGTAADNDNDNDNDDEWRWVLGVNLLGADVPRGASAPAALPVGSRSAISSVPGPAPRPARQWPVDGGMQDLRLRPRQ